MSYNCTRTFELSVSEAQEAHQKGFLILNDCSRGPEPGDELIERREPYSIYKAIRMH